MYNGLVQAIRSATVETLAADASDLITLIETQYRVSESEEERSSLMHTYMCLCVYVCRFQDLF